MLLFQVLEAIAPPYTAEFVQLFLPMVEDEEITGTMRGDNDNDLVSEFIGKIFIFNIKKENKKIYYIIYFYYLFSTL